MSSGVLPWRPGSIRGHGGRRTEMSGLDQPRGWSVTTSPSDVRSGAWWDERPPVIFPVSMSITTVWNG